MKDMRRDEARKISRNTAHPSAHAQRGCTCALCRQARAVGCPSEAHQGLRPSKHAGIFLGVALVLGAFESNRLVSERACATAVCSCSGD